MRAWHRLQAIGLAVAMCGNVWASGPEMESRFDTKTKVRLAEGGIWLEAEISPRALLTAMPSCDRNGDQRLDEGELSHSRNEILAYFAAKVKLHAAGKTLHADSTYFAFRSPATPSALPDRFYIYHWYAMLRQPEQVQVNNALFMELQEDCRHEGAFINGEQRLPFEFIAQNENGALATSTRAFYIASNGEVSLNDEQYDTLHAGYVWASLGIFGFVFFRLASAARNKWGRNTEEEDDDEDEEELSLTQSAVLN